MKKLIISLCLSITSTTYALADTSIESNPLLLLIGFPNVTALFDVNDKVSVGPKLSAASITIDDESLSLLKLDARAEYMPSGNDDSGLYIAGEANFTAIHSETTYCEAESSGLGATAKLGYKWIAQSGIVTKVGAGYTLGSYSDYDTTCDDGYSYSFDQPAYSGMTFDFTVGYKF